MLVLISPFGVWDWLIAGGSLLVLEALAPGVILLWLGLAALLVGGMLLYIDLIWQAQFIAFVVFFIAFAIFFVAGNPPAMQLGATTDQPFLNRRAEALVGRIFTLEKPIVGGFGTVRIEDTVWRITGADISAGSRIKVTRVDGTALHVEPVRNSFGLVESSTQRESSNAAPSFSSFPRLSPNATPSRSRQQLH